MEAIYHSFKTVVLVYVKIFCSKNKHYINSAFSSNFDDIVLILIKETYLADFIFIEHKCRLPAVQTNSFDT